ncbi:hypothetical protein QQS21_012823 [Conoideocrella luteorostrata]|uniref:Terpene synthase n=1 Tax=Conoideocrella luteorostrata TaxID=1105319 RepID=A0AAJ0CBL4_9HYPO|nr:hypothetical protein QQS21_012823 [Conoideocrella luteorostrata]
MERGPLLDLLRGRTVRIPNLKALFNHWPCGRSPHYEALIPVVDLRLESLVHDPVKLKKLKSADFALFTSCWWPLADFERSRIVAYFVIWLFLWDDEIDESSGSLTNDFNNSQTYRARTFEFVEQCLGLKNHNLAGQDLHPFISSFEPIGQALYVAYTRSQAQKFMVEMQVFMDASETEQHTRLDGGVMDLETYWKVRLGTSAVGLCSAMIEYVNHTTIPVDVATSLQMQIIWHETNMIVSIVNDVLSLKKELRKDGIDSLVPLTVAAGTPPQEAISRAVADIRSCVLRFDKAANTLIQGKGEQRSSWGGLFEVLSSLWRLRGPETDIDSVEEKRSRDALEAFVATSRQNCTGNLAWRYVYRTAVYVKTLYNIQR